MKKFIIPFIISFLCLGFISLPPKPETPEDVLKQIPIVDSFKLIKNDSLFTSTYEVWFRMPVDHNNPESPMFPLRVYYSHKDFKNPVLAILDGYTMYTSRSHELSHILNSNQITIEHRFFYKSRPKDSIPWKYLNVEQAAADEHAIIQAFKRFYPGKWISTGISKSGQTTIYHRSLYPHDVDVSIPYVAPLNFSNQDPRVYTFLKNVGTEECRKKIYSYQTSLFEHKKEIFPMFEKLAKEKNWIFKMGLDRAYDLSVLEYPFAFWQWGIDCDAIPYASASVKTLFAHWANVEPFTFFEESSIENTRPFFFQAMTETGMYGYEVKPFQKYLKDTTNITFDFTMPKGYKAVFNPNTMRNVQKWIETSGNNMLYIYGQNDAWSSTAVEPGKHTNAVKMVKPGGSHSTRIKNFPPQMQDSIYTVLEKWLDINLSAQKHTCKTTAK